MMVWFVFYGLNVCRRGFISYIFYVWVKFFVVEFIFFEGFKLNINGFKVVC